MHKRVIAASIITSRTREVLNDFNMSCDDSGKLILRPRPTNITWQKYYHFIVHYQAIFTFNRLVTLWINNVLLNKFYIKKYCCFILPIKQLEHICWYYYNNNFKFQICTYNKIFLLLPNMDVNSHPPLVTFQPGIGQK